MPFHLMIRHCRHMAARQHALMIATLAMITPCCRRHMPPPHAAISFLAYYAMIRLRYFAYYYDAFFTPAMPPPLLRRHAAMISLLRPFTPAPHASYATIDV